MEGKLEGQQALFCFWIASTLLALRVVCVCVLFGTLPRVLARAIILDPAALSCDAILWILDTRRVFFADALLAILVYFDTPPLCRDTCTSTHFCRTLSGKLFTVRHSSVKIMQHSHCTTASYSFPSDMPTMYFYSLYVCCHPSREGWTNSHVWHLSPSSLLSCAYFQFCLSCFQKSQRKSLTRQACVI